MKRDAGGWAVASVEEVRHNMSTTGYPPEKIRYVKGRVEDTIPGQAPDAIALLRLDTDWYESTRHELVHLMPRVVANGIVIVDDYGHWEGARRAVDEFVAHSERPIFLARIDYSCRLIVMP